MSTLRMSPAGAVASVVALAACGPSDPSDSDVPVASVRDSAGIEIVEASRDVMEALPTWSLELELDLGGVDAPPEHEFFRVNGTFLLPDGGVAVANTGSSEIRFFDAEGRLEAVAGREGEGPGELLSVAQLWALPRDSVLFYDRRLQRLSVIGPSREIVRSARLGGAMPNGRLIGVLGGNQALVEDMTFTLPTSATPVVGNAELLLFDLAGGDAVAKVGDFPERLWVRVGEGIGMPELGPFTTFAVLGSDIWVGTGRDYEVRQVDRAGGTTRISRWWGPDRTVTEDDRGRWLEQRLLEADEQDRPRVRQDAAQTIFAEQKAAYYQVLATRRGELWIQDYQPFPEEANRWLVLDRSGRPLAFLRTPAALMVRDAVEDRVGGELHDELGVEHVVVYRIVKR